MTDSKNTLRRLVGFLELLLASPDQQEAWARLEGFPSEELALQLYDALPHWLPELKAAHLVDERAERSLLSLIQQMELHQSELFCDGPRVTSSQEWEHIRALAKRALGLIGSKSMEDN